MRICMYAMHAMRACGHADLCCALKWGACALLPPGTAHHFCTLHPPGGPPLHGCRLPVRLPLHHALLSPLHHRRACCRKLQDLAAEGAVAHQLLQQLALLPAAQRQQASTANSSID